MARYRAPQRPNDSHQRKQQTQQITEGAKQISLPLRDLRDQLSSLVDEIKSNNQKDQTKEGEYRGKSLFWTTFSTISSVILTLLTLVILYRQSIIMDTQSTTMTNQLREMEKSNGINREALISVQRAFVNFKTMKHTLIQNTQGEILGWRFSVQWENSGTTPTRTLMHHANFGYFKEPIPPHFSFPDQGTEEISAALIAPKSAMDVKPLFISRDIVNKIRNGQGHLYFWGWAAYRDIFKDSKPHVTEF